MLDKLSLNLRNKKRKPNRFNSEVFLLLSQARTWISKVICCDLVLVLSGLRCKVIVYFVDVDGILSHIF